MAKQRKPGPLTILVIGDPHFKVSNAEQTREMVKAIVELAKKRRPDIIVCLGDTLDTHGRLHTDPLCEAIKFFKQLKRIAPLRIIIGNHDRRNNSDFLTDRHPFTAIDEEWTDTLIADKVLSEIANDHQLVYVPYVPNGKFIEALDGGVKGYIGHLFAREIDLRKITSIDHLPPVLVRVIERAVKGDEGALLILQHEHLFIGDEPIRLKQDKYQDLNDVVKFYTTLIAFRSMNLHKQSSSNDKQLNDNKQLDDKELNDNKQLDDNHDQSLPVVRVNQAMYPSDKKDESDQTSNNLKSTSNNLASTSNDLKSTNDVDNNEVILVDPWWKKASLIFAHQEFEGAKMGAIISESGDKWPLDAPLIVSGHIHDHQQPQPNIQYTGTPIQHAFGDSADKTVSFISWQLNESLANSSSGKTETVNGKWVEERVDLGLIKRKMVKMRIHEFITWQPPPGYIVKAVIEGTPGELRTVRAMFKIKQLREEGVIISIKTLPEHSTYQRSNEIKASRTYLVALQEEISSKNKYRKEMLEWYKKIFGGSVNTSTSNAPINRRRLKLSFTPPRLDIESSSSNHPPIGIKSGSSSQPATAVIFPRSEARTPPKINNGLSSTLNVNQKKKQINTIEHQTNGMKLEHNGGLRLILRTGKNN